MAKSLFNIKAITRVCLGCKKHLIKKTKSIENIYNLITYSNLPQKSFLGIIFNTRRILIAILFLIAFLAVSSPARQLYGSLSGSVIDSRSGISISGADVEFVSIELSDTTDIKGIFTIDSIPVGFWDITVKAKGYTKRLCPSQQIKSGKNREIVIEITKDIEIYTLDKMVVQAQKLTTKNAQQTSSVFRLTRDEILTAPGAGQDFVMVLQGMPSVAGGSHRGFNQLLVRGGKDDENMFLVDDIEVNTLSHWGTQYEPAGGVSILHPDYIKGLDFYAGGIPANFPPRLSSVSDIHFREGSMSNRTFQIDLNTGGFGLFLEGPIVRKKASYIANARVGVTDLMTILANLGGMPKYQNGQMKLVWDVGEKDKIVANMLAGHETIILNEDGSDGRYWHENDGKHGIGGLQWQHLMDMSQNRLLFSGIYHKSKWEDIIQDSITESLWESRRLRFQLKDDFKLFIRDNDVISLGMAFEQEKFDEHILEEAYYVYADTVDSIYHYFLHRPDNTSEKLDSIDEVTGRNISYEETGYRIGAYLNYALFLLNRLKFNFGFRDDYFTLPREHGLSPRCAVSLDLGRTGTFSLSGGLYRQQPVYLSLVSDSVNLWDLELQRAVQAAAGLEKQLTDVVFLGTEVFYKYYDREPVYRLTTLDSLNPNSGTRQISIEPDHYSRKKAYGLEFYLQKKRMDAFFYQFSYSLSNVIQEYADGKWYDDDNNLRNSATIILGSNFHKSHRISLRFDISEGYPYTPIDRQNSDQFKITYYDISEGWNYKRRPIRLKLNLRYDLSLYLSRANVVLYLEGYNLLNQRDIVYEYYARGEKYPEGRIIKMFSRSILPGLGLYITF